MTILSPLELAVLQALIDACDCSLSAHVPKEAVARRMAPNLKGEVQKYLRKLRAKGYCCEHPTGGNTTWQLTSTGLNEGKNSII